ncbi:F-box protein FBW2-like [Macadamia integrifolia]|uniref:F-box protein FBW2-like n=1 Tax=Macadamia integrifolia TaxID=60698 RepID=UPI001C4E4B65|nr:F-box protein FBW2-like [Macadamia integrifolia]XP_042487315.1 F-box protein FBW2-like [Macadamia integrifolia]
MEGGDIHCWDQLIPDALALIFNNLSLEEKLTVIPRICKSWRKAVMGPLCWQEIDIEEWCYGRQPELLDQMLQMLIGISGSPRKLCVVGLSNDAIFSLIADHAGSLQTLQIPGSKISDSIVEEVAGRMSAITFLDLSYCENIGARALKAFGSNCRLLSSLRRNMHSSTWIVNNDEAHAIATTMPELKHLEIGNMDLTTEGVLDILSGCQKLGYLDVRGCWRERLDGKFLNEKYSGLKVRRTFDDVPEDIDWDSFNFKEYWDDYQEELEELMAECLMELGADDGA